MFFINLLSIFSKTPPQQNNLLLGTTLNEQLAKLSENQLNETPSRKRVRVKKEGNLENSNCEEKGVCLVLIINLCYRTFHSVNCGMWRL